ncbi:MAG: hypothetical protein GY791_01415 [Alphaproteobacteria bacterium]|nr:hypothetical protein [Alphaproteobacteria bacterium]
MKKEEVLKMATGLVTGDRHDDYGDATECCDSIAEVWTWWIDDRLAPGRSLDAHDVAIMMDLLKTSRIKTGAPKIDNYVDKCGYAALAAEVGSKLDG